MTIPTRVRAGFGLVAAIGAVAAAADVGTFALVAPQAASPAARCPASHASDPYNVAARFLTTAVERKNLRTSYALATPSLRRGVSCRDWLRGRVPLPEVANIDWARSGYKPVAGGGGLLVLRIYLAQKNAALPELFVMELRQGRGGWQVGRFQADETAPSPALAL